MLSYNCEMRENQMKRTCNEMIKEAIEKHDLLVVRDVLDCLRFSHGYTYDKSAAWVCKVTGITKEDFEVLSAEVDSL
jgi:hypothetical protein